MRSIADIQGANRGSPPNFVADAKAALGEFFGMGVFIFLALSGVQAALEAPTGLPASRGPTVSQIQSVGFSFGAGITVGLFLCGPISGGVLNPAVLLSLVLSGNINWLRGILYLFAEMGGAIIGAYFANFVTAHELQGVNLLNPGFNYAQGFFAEVLMTCTLCLTVLFIIVDKTPLADFAPFVVGLSVFMCHIVGTPIDGTSINPARSFAASIVSGKWANHWIFWFGPLIGGIFAYCIYMTCKILTTEPQGEELAKQAEQQEREEKDDKERQDRYNRNAHSTQIPDPNAYNSNIDHDRTYNTNSVPQNTTYVQNGHPDPQNPGYSTNYAQNTNVPANINPKTDTNPTGSGSNHVNGVPVSIANPKTNV
ncbi:hypothetical protein INT47_012892 [Mucor saturninus]|uniref:Aquaporin n=1 Tax=Mucor saturninus TaxID=64648 RepID=A0A8H7UY54_9FUNG|nr:hypothetical protein INT47_012892 [Mucor saturninus]